MPRSPEGSLVVRFSGIGALPLPLLQLLLFLAALFLFFLPLLGGARLGLLFALQLSELLFLLRERFGRAVECVR